ncbi:PIN domain-containing protein [Actinocrispum wychmicini]|uniref:PIN domain-containing protein n=1 Tax=Actinocrispum wychmicini TaxID=1213861 RepID=A0A4R2KDN0_9PSEU|nr:PIN domain-containing protein [Actinocrispum wychmicini]TCO64625.1 PIN domain-containing protein [Actinocrispum wychmicini]
MTPIPAFLDACVLVPIRLTDLLLRLAEAGVYSPLWSFDVLYEVEQNLPKLGISALKALRRTDKMRQEFPEAEVTGYEALIPGMTNHPKDRHVLAAAVTGGAAVIVTANLRDFQGPALKPHKLVATHPDDFLVALLDTHFEVTVRCVREQFVELTNPPVSLEQFVISLARTVPRFTGLVRPYLP